MSSEIRDRVEKDWAKVMSNIPTMRKSVDIGSLIEVLLAHQDVAIVDREAELPTITDGEIDMALLSNLNKTKAVRVILNKLEERTLKVGWVKEVKDNV